MSDVSAKHHDGPIPFLSKYSAGVDDHLAMKV